MTDGSGPLPDSNWELASWIGIGLFVVAAFTVFSGLDAQVEYVANAPQDYFLSASSDGSEGVTFTREAVDLMNEVSSRSLGRDAVGAERLYCGTVRNGQVRQFRLADRIIESDLTSVRGSCISDVAPVEIWVHSQPDGSSQLSDEDKSLESTGAEYTCIQYAEIARSPVTGKLSGINCWEIVNEGERFDPVPVYS